MPSSQFSPSTVFDYLFSFEAGMDSGTSPLLLPKNQLAWGSNLTTRGDLIHPRPPRRILTLNFSSPDVQNAVIKGLWQGGCYYKPDNGNETLVASISGRLFQFTPIGTVATVTEVTGVNPQSAVVTQCWLWQAENYVFWNDGINLPVFFNGATTARSNGTTPPVAPVFTTAATFFIPAGYNSTFPVIPITLTANFTGANGDTIGINLGSTLSLTGAVVAGAGTPNITVNLNYVNTSATPISVKAGSILQDTQGLSFVPQFPVGRMGCYGRGRVWMSLADGQQFIAGDIVGGPSGTKALNFRNAILNITENDFLVGGGTFRVPGSIGDIRAMIFTAQLDVSLGQGPLMVFTPTHVFSCDAPVDRLTWQSLTNPILTEAAIGNGGLGQYSTYLVNSDTHSRSIDGIRSLILAAADFNQWIRTPISHEVERVLRNDNQSLLPFGSGLFFDNRTLMTVSPTASATQGVFHQGVVALNTDLLTTVREKQQPAYDGVWPGMNIFPMMTGQFSLVERCYQFCFNTVLSTLELWELLSEKDGDVEKNPNPIVGDNGTQAIEWWFESGSMGFGDKVQTRTFKSLLNGEIIVDKLVGRVDFQAFYKPDQYPCWVPWINWSECAVQNTGSPGDINKPQFRPRMGLGEPSAIPCDSSTNRPFRNFYTMQFKLVISGQCEFIGARFAAVVIPEPTFAPPSCVPIC
jgi:hypothetical protein